MGPEKVNIMRKHIICVALAVAALAACKPQDAIYQDLYNQAYKANYPQMAANLAGEAGYLCAYLYWDIPVSPTCTEAVIYWDFKKDSLKISLSDPQYNIGDCIRVKIDGLEEKDYTFDVYTIDTEGSRSLPSEVLISPKGPDYAATLSGRNVLGAVVSEINGAGVVNWDARSKVSPFSEIRYKDASSREKTVVVEPSESSTVLRDINLSDPSPIEYRSVFVTDACADTLYSAWTQKAWFVDPDYASTVAPGTYCLSFTQRKNVTVTRDAVNPNQFVFECTDAAPSIFVDAITEPVTKPILVYQYKQTLNSSSTKVYWVDKGGSVGSRRYSSLAFTDHASGSDEWSVAIFDMEAFWTTHLWSGNVGDYARLDMSTTAGNVITIRNVHFRDRREGE